MDVFDLQAKISVDTAPYLAALQAAARETETLRRSMSAPITPFGGSTPSTPGSGTGGGGSTPSTSTLPTVTNQAQEAGKAIDDLNKKLSEGVSAACKVGAAAFGTFSTALVAGTKKAVDGFAQYEQLVGGVDTLFKESAQTVQKYAEQAYKTAGMSANTYMQTITSFSASLLNSLDNDTEKAAEKANTAITDMADNSNKMGTSLESLTRAYMGFSRGNFVMLDNLALGFSGTKQGMQELLDKAEELSGIKYDISSYADIVDAIHVVQQEMGITGTTAKEASETIEGSMNSTKAAIDNLIVGFARSDADIDKLMGDVETNISNLAKNAIPVAERAFVNLTKYAIEAGMKIADELPKLIRKATEDVHKMIASTFGEGANTIFGIEAALKAAAAAFVTFKAAAYVADVVDKIRALNTALQGTVTLSEAMNAANLANPWVLAATAIAAATVGLKSWIDAQTDAIQEAVDGYDLLEGAQKAAYDSLRDTIDGVYDSRKAYEESYAAMESNSSAIQKNIDALYELDAQEKLSNEDKVKMKALVDDLNSSVEGLNIKLNEQNGHLETQKKDIDDLIKSYQNQARTTVLQERLIKLTREQYDLEDKYKSAYSERAKALKRVNELEGQRIKAEKEYNEALKKWQESNGTMYENEMNAAEKALEGISKELDIAKTNSASFATEFSNLGALSRENKAEIEGLSTDLATLGATYDETTAQAMGTTDILSATTNILSATTNAIQQIAESTEGFWLNIRDNTHVLSLETAEQVGEIIDAYDELYDKQYEAIAKSVDLYKGFEADTSVTYNDLLNNLQQSEFYLNDWTTAIDQLQTKVDKGLMSQQFLDSLKNMGLDSWNIVYNMNHATEGQLKEYSDLWVKTNNGIKESTDKLTADQKESAEKQIAEITGIAGASMEEYKKAFTDVGVAIGDGLVDGIHSKIKEAQAKIKEMGEGVIQIGKETLKVNSPSEEFREIGNYIVEGLILGINEKTSLAEETVRDLAKKTVLTLEKEMQIESPSKVMKELGRYTSEGYAIGIEDNAKEVYSAMKLISENAQNAIDTDKIDLVGTRKIRSLSKSSDEGETTFSGLSIRTLTEAFKEAITDLVSGDIVVEGTLDGEKLLEVIFPKIDAMQGKRAEAAIRGYAT